MFEKINGVGMLWEGETAPPPCGGLPGLLCSLHCEPGWTLTPEPLNGSRESRTLDVSGVSWIPCKGFGKCSRDALHAESASSQSLHELRAIFFNIALGSERSVQRLCGSSRNFDSKG